MSTTLMTIGGLTLGAIGTARVRTEYEGATIEGLVTDLVLGIDRTAIRGGAGVIRDHIEVHADLTLGRIELQGLSRSHPCEVIS